MYAMRIFGCWGKMPQQAGISPNTRLAQLVNGAKHPLVSCNAKSRGDTKLIYMRKGKTETFDVFKSEKGDSLFTEQFHLWNSSDWNKDLPPYFERLNKIDDDRSFVILSASVLEYQTDRFLKCFIPKYQILISTNTNFSTKINVIRAFNLIPSQIGEILDLIRNIRNDFAHNLSIDSFQDVEKSETLPVHVKELERFWKKYESQMAYWKKGSETRLLFKDIWRVSLEALRVYEDNIILFRKETENKEFMNHLMTKSEVLKSVRENSEKRRP